jgi:hypothetical protein
MSELNLSTLFDDSHAPCLLSHAALTAQDDTELRSARIAIRDRLRRELPGRLRDSEGRTPVKVPRFFTQGSYSYKTIIRPLRPPVQQADLDDGVYLPLGEFRGRRPSVASDAFIGATDEILGELAVEKKWGFSRENPHCSRLVIARDKHVDVPRYCIPDAQFGQLLEKAALRRGITKDEMHAQGADEDDWDLMPVENVLLAHRDDGWIKSDPRPVAQWIAHESDRRGSHFLKVIKILKSWRDFQQWPPGCDPKSILIMALVHHAEWQQYERRLDKTLLHVVKQVPALLIGPVPNPAAVKDTADEPDLSKRLDEEGIRGEVRSRFSNLADILEYAVLKCGDPERATELLREIFGARVPMDASRIARVTVEVAPAVHVKSQPPVRRTQAG